MTKGLANISNDHFPSIDYQVRPIYEGNNVDSSHEIDSDDIKESITQPSVIDEHVKEQWILKAHGICWQGINMLVDAIKTTSPISRRGQLNNKSNQPKFTITSDSYQLKLFDILFSLIEFVPLNKLTLLLGIIKKLLLGDGYGPLIQIENSSFWKVLYDNVSTSDAIDYNRRKEVFVWYLELLKEISLLVKSNEISSFKEAAVVIKSKL
jgi:hypothetical protein